MAKTPQMPNIVGIKKQLNILLQSLFEAYNCLYFCRLVLSCDSRDCQFMLNHLRLLKHARY